MFQDAQGQPLSRDALLARMKDHIQTVVGRYKGRIKGWDVVNEALNEDGTLRESPWMQIIGPDYIAKAFQYAHEADPAAELYYNDYNLDYRGQARRRRPPRAIAARSAGFPSTRSASQEHLKLTTPTASRRSIRASVHSPRLGVKVNVTELDIDLLPPATRNAGADVVDASRTRAEPQSVRGRTSRLDAAGARTPVRGSVPRLSGEPGRDRPDHLLGRGRRGFVAQRLARAGRTSYPLLFDRQLGRKPAYDAVSALANAPRVVP